MPIHPYDRRYLLTLSNPLFIKDLERFFLGAYESDCAIGDVATDILPDSGKQGIALITAKNNGVFCGGPLIEWFFKNLYENFSLNFPLAEGEDFKKGRIVLEIKGPWSGLLRTERTVLNILQRLCGIATITDQYRKVASPTPIAATRKTQLGLLDKYAVAIGGGLTHRLHLGDAPIFKENHLMLLENDMPELLKMLSKLPFDIPFATIELETVDQYLYLLENLPLKSPWPLFLMFDEFEATQLNAILQKNKAKRPDYLFYEASGGITMNNIKQYANIGLNVISVGAITHSAPLIDLSLAIIAP